MKIRVLCFAQTRELTGRPELEVELPPGATVADLRSALLSLHPPLAALELRIAVDRAFALPAQLLADGAEAALIPPVAGG